MTTMTVSEARSNLHEVLDRVEKGEEVTITRHGRSVAVVVPPDALRSRRAERILAVAEQTGAALAAARSRGLGLSGGLSAERADELVAAIRSDRDSRP